MKFSLKRSLIVVLLLCCGADVYSHNARGYHVKDIIDVLGLKETSTVWDWGGFISDNIDRIDVNGFYKKLQDNHKGFRISPGAHRMFFHWGYNAIPWNKTIEKKVRDYCEKNGLNKEKVMSEFKSELKQEQRRRNKNMKFQTSLRLGLDAKWANLFTSMAYNVHLLGDYQTDNRDLNGLQDLNELIGLFVIDLRTLDNEESRSVISEITRINKSYSNPQKKADALMDYMKKAVPTVIQKAQKGSIYRILKNKGLYD